MDILHLGGRTARSPGGAGLYTALAAARAGADVTMVGPRPDPIPPELVAVPERLEWLGPPVDVEGLPRFEIAHTDDGRTEMRDVQWRAEAALTADHLPADRSFDLAYVIPLARPTRQVELLEHLRQGGARLAAGTYPGAFSNDPDAVRQALRLVDFFFCNEREAREIFGGGSSRSCRAACRAGQVIFVTRASAGVTVVQGSHSTGVAAPPVEELDPTGAGDTFCGTTLAWLGRGAHPIEAAGHGTRAAAEAVTGIGPARLFESPAPVGNGRVHVDRTRVGAVGARLADVPEAAPFAFDGPLHPPVDHPGALDVLFASTLQQFGFWRDDGKRYRGPIVAALGGRDLKGSDYLAASYRRWLEEAPAGLRVEAQAELQTRELRERLADDRGVCPFPDVEVRAELARRYGRDLLELDSRPSDLVRRSNAAERPLRHLLGELDHVAGYKEDPLRKKSALLGIILRQRPEGFLESAAGDDAPPIVDYHVQRSCLRLGLVVVDDADMRERLAGRRLLEPIEEAEIRQTANEAVALLQSRSGLSMGALDAFLFENRSRCPEMSEPDCARCPVDEVCAHAKELFQPVLRTTFY